MSTFSATSAASELGSGLNVVGISEGGLSCTRSIVVSESQTAVSCFCAAKHTSSSNGGAGREMSVTSDGSAVIALKRSLSAYKWTGFTSAFR